MRAATPGYGRPAKLPYPLARWPQVSLSLSPGWLTICRRAENRKRLSPALLVGLALAIGLTASPARAADTIYWANYGGGKIGLAALDGSGGGDLETSEATPPASPAGVAIDAAAGRIYWADGNGPISFANLNGSGGGGDLSTTGAVTSGVRGLAIDPAAGRLYWVNQGAPAVEAIAYANLNGSGGGYLSSEGATPPASPTGLAIDPVANRIYWADQGAGKQVSFASLDGSGGGGDLDTTGANLSDPTGLAIDPGSGRLYVTDFGGRISFISLDDSGGGELSLAPFAPGNAFGLAIDPGAGKVYWADFAPEGAIDRAALAGGEGETLDTSGASGGGSSEGFLYPALLEKPVGAGPPTIGGGSTVGATLSCTQGNWAGDLLGSYLYRVPRSFAYQWSRDGTDIGGATSSTLGATSAGAYRCRVMATNDAGSTSQTSDPLMVTSPPQAPRPNGPPPPAPRPAAPSNRFTVGKARLNKKTGTASLSVSIPGPGRLSDSLGGPPSRGNARASAVQFVGAAGTVRLAISATGKSKRTLKRQGRVKLTVNITFTPNGGTPASKARQLTLIKKR